MEKENWFYAAGGICRFGSESAAVFTGRCLYGGFGDYESDCSGAWKRGRVRFLASDSALSDR